MKNWYSNKFRRHLLDMHIDDWNDDFLAQFSPEDYYNNLKAANLNVAMIYFHSHVGHCYYPTKVGHIHKAFVGKEDMMKRLVNLCHQGGIKVIGYYSPNFDVWAHDTHPEWRMVDTEGKSNREKAMGRTGLCCPNNPEYRAHVLTQVREIAEYFNDIDGMFFDFPLLPQYCYCDSCKEKWTKEHGGEIPTSKKDVRWELFEESRRNWIADYAKALHDEIKKYIPNISVEQNYACAALPSQENALSELVNKSCDYVGGDICRNVLTQSFACKLFYGVTNNQPFEFMTVRCEPNLTAHTLTKSKDKLTLGVMLTCAHHGANLIIDGIDPVGTMDERFYNSLGEILTNEEKYEKYLTGDMVQNVAIYYSLRSRVNQQNQGFSHYTGSMNMVKALTEYHIPVGVVSKERDNTLEKYPFIILSDPNHLPEESVDKLIDYVENGGTLYFSNTNEKKLFDKLIGGKVIGYTKDVNTYVAPKENQEYIFNDFNNKYPIPFKYSLPMVEGIEGANIVATIKLPYETEGVIKFSSFHSNPPGIDTDYPAMAIKEYGKGKVIWSAAPFENEPLLAYKNIMVNLITNVGGVDPVIETNAGRNIELVTFEDKNNKVVRISAVTLTDEDTTVIQPSFIIKYRTNKPVSAVKLLPSEAEIPFEYNDGIVTFKTRELNIFDMYQIEME